MCKSIILTIISIILFTKIQYGQCIIDDNYINFTNEIQTKVFNENFVDALGIIDKEIKNNPNDCRYYFLKSALYYWKEFVYRNDATAENNFLANIDKTINLANKVKEQDSKNACVNFILGASYGYKGLYYLDKKSMFSTIKNASKGVNYLNAALKIDPSFVDCYYGLGIYNYNAGKANFFIRLILPIFFNSADKEKGIDYLEHVSREGKMSKDNADFTLALIYDREENYNMSRNYLTKLVLKYPGSSIFSVYLMTNILNYKKDYGEVIKTGINFLHNTDENDLINKRMGSMIYFLLAKSYEMLTDYRNALVYMEKYLRIIKNDKNALESVNIYKAKLNVQSSGVIKR